jgi:hypothetical protein
VLWMSWRTTRQIRPLPANAFGLAWTTCRPRNISGRHLVAGEDLNLQRLYLTRSGYTFWAFLSGSNGNEGFKKDW